MGCWPDLQSIENVHPPPPARQKYTHHHRRQSSSLSAGESDGEWETDGSGGGTDSGESSQEGLGFEPRVGEQTSFPVQIRGEAPGSGTFQSESHILQRCEMPRMLFAVHPPCECCWFCVLERLGICLH